MSNPVSGQPERKLRALFNREPEGEHRRHPKEDRERIDRHDERADVENRRDIERDHRPKAGVRVEQAPPK